jgi:hypothetical protein
MTGWSYATAANPTLALSHKNEEVRETSEHSYLHYELWITAAGTSMLNDIRTGSSNSTPGSCSVLTAPYFVTGTLIATPVGGRMAYAQDAAPMPLRRTA